MSFMFKKWCSLISKAGHYVTLCQKILDTPVNDRPSLFGIDSIHWTETSLSHALLVYYYTKSMVQTNRAVL
jgi:hypothetical protein